MARMVAVAVASGLLGVGAALPAQAQAQVQTQTREQAQSQVRAYYPDVDRIVCEINAEREANHRPALRISDKASQVARAHAKDMAARGELTTVGSDGRELRDRLDDAGLYSGYISEYMLSGYHHDGRFADLATDPSPDNGLYKALMSRDIVALGIGYDHEYWDVDMLGPHRKLVTRAAVCAGPRAA
ncbi:CAP domain-containing protein [Streptomyces sp. NPDC050095]|uniref:CAP domain-containing protein n=1 Tax=unclassified Streptomyces TaxID=2593676 RepID=UPI00342B1801